MNIDRKELDKKLAEIRDLAIEARSKASEASGKVAELDAWLDKQQLREQS